MSHLNREQCFCVDRSSLFSNDLLIIVIYSPHICAISLKHCKRVKSIKMVASSCSNGDYDWAKQVKQFDETKAGVKGLVDTGITNIPDLFVHPQKSLESNTHASSSSLELPTIDFGELQSGAEGRRKVVAEIRNVAQEWGFFRIVNHSIPLETMDAMLAAVKRFHELPNADKAPFYADADDAKRRVRFSSNLPTRANAVACWRDFLTCVFQDDKLDPEELPSACR